MVHSLIVVGIILFLGYWLLKIGFKFLFKVILPLGLIFVLAWFVFTLIGNAPFI